MENNKENVITRIRRNINDTPVIINGTISENCILENSLVGDSALIDKTFIDEILSKIDLDTLPNDLIQLLTNIYNIIVNYFSSEEENKLSRAQTYSKYALKNEEGANYATKMSSLKGKNISMCSEKSITAYIILNYLFKKNKNNYKPSFVLSTLKTEKTPMEYHAFVMLDNDDNEYPTKHLIFDVQNLQLINYNGNDIPIIGLYSLTDEQFCDIVNGIKCTPTSTYEIINENCHEISDKKTFGSIEKSKSIN